MYQSNNDRLILTHFISEVLWERIWRFQDKVVLLQKVYQKPTIMEDDKKKYDDMEFEDTNFVNECLESFDENISKIEAEYEVGSKSA